VRVIGSKPLASIRDATFNWAKLHRSLECAETIVALRGPRDCALKVDRVMLDLIMVHKVDCLKIREC
jgi:hypothetical protein